MPRNDHFYYSLPKILELLDENEIIDQIPKLKLQKTYWDELEIGDKASLHINVSRKLILLFAMISNDYNPIHVDRNFIKTLKMFDDNIAHGMLLASLCSGVVGSKLVGEGVAVLNIDHFSFKQAVKIGDNIIATAEIIKKYFKEIRGKKRYYIDIKLLITFEDSHNIAADAVSTLTVFNKSRP